MQFRTFTTQHTPAPRSACRLPRSALAFSHMPYHHGWLHAWEDNMRYIIPKTDVFRCNELRGALLLPMSFSCAVFCSGRSHMVSRCVLKPSATWYGADIEHSAHIIA